MDKSETKSLAQPLALILSKRQFLGLRLAALNNGVTMSWQLRAVVKEYLKSRPLAFRLKRRRTPIDEPLRFNLVLYGEREWLHRMCHSRGYDTSEVIRSALQWFLDLKINIRPWRMRFVKGIKLLETSYQSFGKDRGGFSDVQRMSAAVFRKGEYWPHDTKNCLFLLARSFRMRPFRN